MRYRGLHVKKIHGWEKCCRRWYVPKTVWTSDERHRRSSRAPMTLPMCESIVITHIFLFPFLSLFLSRGSFTLSVELNVCRFACNYFICLLCNASAPCVSPWRDRPLANRIRIRESGVDLFIGREREREREDRETEIDLFHVSPGCSFNIQSYCRSIL